VHELNGSEVAVIGLALRFPGAQTPEQLWENLKNRVESLRSFTDEELLAAGEDPAAVHHPTYVKARPAIDGIELFDAELFGVPAREARLIDPQHRLFLECCWEALERAGCDSETYPGAIGVYAGTDLNSYLFRLVMTPGLMEEVGVFQLEVASDKEYLASRVSYKLDLRGPSLAVQTACSTSLVAVHLACQGLLSGECDVALAGGASVQVPQVRGYFAPEGGIQSRDGHCRSFDARAQGTVFGSGVGVVVLKRLTDALADGDAVRAVIKGSAVNNDGARKVGYTAPGGDGQARVIRAAQLMAEVDPDTITYVEAHGTGTALGDPIEVAALTQAFRATTDRKGFCAIGSLKPNLGHLKSAAGVAGLIKAVLCLEHRILPPLLHLEQPNPHIDFANSPFFPVDRLRAWEPAEGAPLRGAVSSFGVGGTNAHVIVEEAPAAEPSGPSRPWQILPLSAATASALEQVKARLAQHLRDHPGLPLADIAWTLQSGRRAGRHRAFAVASDLAGAVAALESPERVQAVVQELRDRPAAFLFPGQGAQHPGMARDLYATEPAFRAHLDRCCEILRPHLGLDLREAIFPAAGDEEGAARRLEQTALAQPALFAVEWSLARLWMDWGVRPRAMLGHSLGEYVAACLAGVFSLEDALALVAERGRLMQELPPGAMLSVPLPEEELRPRLGGSLALAAVNGPGRSVVSGEEGAVAALEAELAAAGVAVRRLRTSHAFHSPMVEPAVAAFAERVRAVRRQAPELPFVSNLTGTWITAEQAADPAYWARHLRETVRFGDGLRTLAADGKTVFLETGPGQTLSAFARQSGKEVVASLPHPKDAGSAAGHLMGAVGRLWLAGAAIDWRAFHAGERRRKVDLPTYPFERKRYWVDGVASGAVRPAARRELADWFQVPAWKPSLPPEEPADASGRWLLLTPGDGLGAALERRLAALGGTVVAVEPGAEFAETAPGRFTLRPGDRDGWAALFARLRGTGALPERVLHLWGLGDVGEAEEGGEDRCFWSLLWLGQELGRLGLPAVQLRVVTDGLQSLAGEPLAPRAPEKALALGPVRVLPLEHPEIGCAAIDVAVPEAGTAREQLADRLIAEALAPPPPAPEPVVAWRGEERRVETFEPLRIPAAGRLPFPERGVCLITGGLGGIGLTLARELARSFRARLVLTGRSAPQPGQAALREIEELGGEVLALAADVTDEAAMREVVRQARERFGPVQAAIHAAGVPGGGVIQLKTAGAAARVLAPKVRGTRALAAALAGEPLELLVLCSSTFALTGGVGQVDYCAANNFLDAFARQASQTSQSGLRAVSLDWGAWQEVGMAVKAAAGAAHRTAGLGAPAPEPPAAAPLHPLLDRRVEPGVYATDLSPARHWVLAEHRILGTPAVPGTAWLEMARAAFARETGEEAVEIRDVAFVSPLLVVEGDRREVRIALAPDGLEGFSFRALSRAGEGWTEHARGSLRRLAAGPPAPRDPAALAARCNVRELAPEGGAPNGKSDGLVFWGPRWQSLRRAELGDGEALVSLALPREFASEAEQLPLHPALLDVATAFGGGALTGGNALPHSYGRLAVYGPLPPRLLAHVRTAREPDPETGAIDADITLDVTLMDEQGNVRVEVERFAMKRTAERGAPVSLAANTAPSAKDKGWIRPEEGVEAFRRALSRGRFSQIAISPTEVGAAALAAMAARAQTEAGAAQDEAPEGGRTAKGTASFARPSLATAYAAPSSEAERALAEVWQRALGFDRIGIHDNFFDLGGDSVVAIQVIAQATARGLSLTPEQLFEHQTIAALARLLEAAPAETPAETSPDPGEPALAVADFPEADLSQESLDRLFARLKEVP
jgi:phthiocerol/phenolphthiocerol synthesis type-I polyketide synthase E